MIISVIILMVWLGSSINDSFEDAGKIGGIIFLMFILAVCLMFGCPTYCSQICYPHTCDKYK